MAALTGTCQAVATVTATATLSDGTTQDVTRDCTFTADPITLAVETAPGQFTNFQKAGSVTAVCAGVTASTLITLPYPDTPALQISPSQVLTPAPTPAQVFPTLYLGESLAMSAQVGRDFSSTCAGLAPVDVTVRTLWTSLTPETCALTPAAIGGAFSPTAGLVKALSPGTCTIQGQDPPSLGQTADITVVPRTIVSLALTAADSNVLLGGNLQLHAIATYDDGAQKDVTYTTTFVSMNPAVADFYGINQALPGKLSAITPGSVVVMATAVDGTTTAVLPLTVGAGGIAVLAIHVSPAGTAEAPVTMPNQTTLAFHATADLSDGTTRDVTDQVDWTVSPVDAVVSNLFLSGPLGTAGLVTATERTSGGPALVQAQMGLGNAPCPAGAPPAPPATCNLATSTLLVN
jgi:hypothetical protein